MSALLPGPKGHPDLEFKKHPSPALVAAAVYPGGRAHTGWPFLQGLLLLAQTS